MIIYGGYHFPRSPGGEGSGGREGSGGGEAEEEEEEEGPQLLRYHISMAMWEVLLVNSSGVHPDPRYGHSAVVYNVRNSISIILVLLLILVYLFIFIIIIIINRVDAHTVSFIRLIEYIT